VLFLKWRQKLTDENIATKSKNRHIRRQKSEIPARIDRYSVCSDQACHDHFIAHNVKVSQIDIFVVLQRGIVETRLMTTVGQILQLVAPRVWRWKVEAKSIGKSGKK